MIAKSKSNLARAAAALLLLAGLSACGLLKSKTEAQAVINQRVVGMPIGDFFDQYGRPKTRVQVADNTIAYTWISALGPTPNSGYYGLDERTCTLRIISGKDGKIVTADIVLDNPGRVSTSRCGEMFKARE